MTEFDKDTMRADLEEYMRVRLETEINTHEFTAAQADMEELNGIVQSFEHRAWDNENPGPELGEVEVAGPAKLSAHGAGIFAAAASGDGTVERNGSELTLDEKLEMAKAAGASFEERMEIIAEHSNPNVGMRLG